MTHSQHWQEYLQGAHVAPEVFELRPDYRVLLLVVTDIIPGSSDITSETLLKEAESSAKDTLSKQPVTEIPHIAAWRDTYKAFGSKPQKYRNSLEALTRRVEAGLPRVNRLTDIYNAISVKRQIPLGGEDLGKYVGRPRCVRATGQEEFETTAGGEKVVEHPNKGEVVWCDDAGVTCRRWNWRQGPRTALTDETTLALFVFDALEPITDGVLEEAADEMVEALRKSSPGLQVARRLVTRADV
ncbi:hypothetical protein LTS08_008030 [Lithohypha guttulata]|uniref:B3/B4 tRNA-binding domain-containing protein n=1 Tax=Lithohypha guttulata TaxID=1690604 RepID=A0AAN7T6J1_9EURO|nr:hypothetical protein LTR51_004616 [Lithohypha guttulata]KAK5091223.1 hypothetical protein LTR05_001404 [Lithohypha guttulata]KAK5095637.1 hypothetical protein LTS08_008030 [Lithohypha guttulata]